MSANKVSDQPGRGGTHPLKFVLWLLIISIIMMFAAFTSAYIVRKEEGDWLNVVLPGSLVFNTVLILASSAFMQWAFVSARKDNLNMVKIGLLGTLALGIAFLFGQWHVWGELVDQKVFFGGATSNPAGSFLYVLTGVHGFHLITGLLYVAIVLGASFRYKVHSRNLLRIELCTIYWHFLGALWVYLYAFLALNQ